MADQHAQRALADTGPTSSPKHVLVVGGGISGAIFAHHLQRESSRPVIVEVAEERALLGAGVAYSASERHQTTNLPMGRMSAIEDDPLHFERWLTARIGVDNEVEHYPSRAAFGLYMDHLLRAMEPRSPASRLLHPHAGHAHRASGRAWRRI